MVHEDHRFFGLKFRRFYCVLAEDFVDQAWFALCIAPGAPFAGFSALF